jgi:TrbC/VIRB2 pilin
MNPVSMPWEPLLNGLTSVLTGPTAGSIAIIALIVCGLVLIFGEDHEKFMTSLLLLGIAISLLVVAASFIPPSLLCRVLGPSAFSDCKPRPPLPKACRGGNSNTCRESPAGNPP